MLETCEEVEVRGRRLPAAKNTFLLTSLLTSSLSTRAWLTNPSDACRLATDGVSPAGEPYAFGTAAMLGPSIAAPRAAQQPNGITTALRRAARASRDPVRASRDPARASRIPARASRDPARASPPTARRTSPSEPAARVLWIDTGQR